MSDNKEKDKDIRELELDLEFSRDLNDLNELMEWMSSPRVYWDNFEVTLPIENNNDIKWISTKIGEA